jgi:FRG domain
MMIVSKIEISDIRSLFDVVENTIRQFDNPGFPWWRGESKSFPEFKPSVFREKHDVHYEQNMIGHFRQLAPARYQNVPERSDHFGWLFLMQHYRLPTRLLDWTESPLVAAFFAVEDQANNSDDGCLYAVDPGVLNDVQFGQKGILLPNNKDGIPFEHIRSAFFESVEDVDSVAAILPSQIDSRMMLQLSCFTVHGSGKSIRDIPNSDKFSIKYIVPAKSKANLLAELQLFGIRESTLFPDLDHLAKELRIREYTHH